MNILLTGGAGYIGSNTAHCLIDQGYKVTVLDNLISGDVKLVPKLANFIEADISDESKVSKLLKNNKFDLVMHFAGLVKVEESIKFPEKYNLYNVDKAKIFFQFCLKEGLKKIIFSSTAGIYGKKKENIKVSETDELQPSNPYAQTKYEIEKYLLNLSKENKVTCIILRYFNVAGADKDNRSGLSTVNSNNLIKVVCELATEKRKDIFVNGDDYNTKDGTPVRDFIHVSDLAEMHIVAAKNIYSNANSEIYNCGYGEGYSVKEVINKMEKILNKKLNYKTGPRRKDDIPYSVANIIKFKEKFNWSPKYNNLELILKSALNWEKKYR